MPPRLWRSGLPKARTGGARLTGTVTRWNPGEAFGFITGENAASFYVSRNDLPRGVRGLAPGTVVSFSADLAPEPGRRYLRARSVRVVTLPDPQGGTGS
jgi:cold shock CspA family protein